MHTRLRVLRSCSKPSCISSINCSKDLKSLTGDNCDDDDEGRDDDDDDSDGDEDGGNDGDEDGGNDGDKDGGNDGDEDGLRLVIGTVNTDVDKSVDVVVDDIVLAALVELSTGKSSSISGKGSSNSIQLSMPIDEGGEGKRGIYI